MLGGMEDEVLDPNGSIPVVYWDVDQTFVALMNGLDVVWDGRENAVLLGGKGVYCEMGIGVVEAKENGIIMVVWYVVWIKG